MSKTATQTDAAIKGIIKAAINCHDQLVFSYDKGEDQLLTRFVVPVEFKDIDDDDTAKVLCKQILPVEGFRHFKLKNIRAAQRVIARQEF
jgi:predicted DNA-binding transcriptional regulator YafY